MASVNNFLTSYFKQLHFNAMDPAVAARWNEYLKLPDLTNSMKDWRDQLMREEPAGSKKYVRLGLPSIEQGKNTERVNAGKTDPGLTDEQIKDLYKSMNNAISGMAGDKRLNYNEFSAAKKFVDSFYGDKKKFHLVELDPNVSNELINLFKPGTIDILKEIIEHNLPEGLSYSELTTKIGDGKYNTDAGFRKKLEQLISNLTYVKYQGLTLNQAQNDLLDKISDLRGKFNPEPNKADVEWFKRSIAKQDDENPLFRLYKATKAKEVFASHDKSDIVGALDTARSEVDYDKTDSDNYLYPKTEKHLNFPQQIKKKWDDFSENRLQKWHNLGGDRMFKSRAANDIVKAINKEKIKPTDGLEAILNNAEKLKTDMVHTGTQTGKHFDWFIKEMNIIKEADGKAFEKCLSNGVSLRGVVSRLVMDAVKTGKVAEAKTALEILSVIKYENTTSKTLEALKADKELFTLLSNPDLSWNKNAGVKFVTGALDKTIRIGGIAIATTATFALNSLRKLGSKIRNENKDLSAAHNAKKAEYNAERKALENAINDSRTRQTNAENILNSMPSKTVLDNNITLNKSEIDTILAKTNSEIKSMLQFMNSGYANDEEISATETFADMYNEYIQGNIDTLSIDDNWPDSVKTRAENVRDILINENFAILRDALKNAKDKKQAFVNATAQLQAATNELNEQEEAMKNWDDDHQDKYDELIKYWNDLERGRDMHLGRMFKGYYSRFGSKKAQQDKFYLKFNNGMTK